MDPQIILIAITILGAITVALLGWIDSGEKFDQRKFTGSIIRAFIAGLASALIFEGIQDVTIFTYLSAFLIGAGVDVTGHRLVGAYSARERARKSL